MSKYIALRCPNCNRKFAYIKVSTGDAVCHLCGITPKADVDKMRLDNKDKN